MKVLNIILVFLFISVISCGDDEGDKPTNGTEAGKAHVDGELFQPEEVTTIETATGLEISLAKGTQKILLSLSNNISGTYIVQNTAPHGRSQDGQEANALFIDGQDIFYAIDGEISLTMHGDATASSTFSFNAKNAAGGTRSLSNGLTNKAPIGKVPKTDCVIIKTMDEEQPERLRFGYNASGNLSHFKFVDTGDIIYVDDYYLTYSDGKLTKMRKIERRDANVDYLDCIISYGADGMLSQIKSSVETISFSHSSGSLVSATIAREGVTTQILFSYDGNQNVVGETRNGKTYGFTEFDSKKNLGQILLNALNNQPALVYYLAGTEFLSKNNAGKKTSPYGDLDEYEYIYNSWDFPVKITERNSDGETSITLLNYVCSQ